MFSDNVVKGFVVVVDGEAVSDEAFGADPSGAQRGDGGAEGGCFGEGSQDGDLASEDVERVDREDVLGVGDAVDEDGAAVAGEWDTVLTHGCSAGCLDDDVVAVSAG